MDEHVSLRALEIDDFAIIQKWHNDRTVTNPLGGNTFFVSKLRETEWLKNALLNDEKNLRLGICIDQCHLIGIVNLTSINWINRSAEFSIMIGEKDHWGKGYGFKTTILCLKHAFEELNLHRVYLTVREDNLNAIRVYTKAGFKSEGLLRDAVYKNNVYLNLVLMSILKNEFNG